MNTSKTTNNFLFPIVIIGIMFFAIGFALGINSYLIPLLKGVLNISDGQSYLVLTATFLAFLLFGYPASLVIGKIGTRIPWPYRLSCLPWVFTFLYLQQKWLVCRCFYWHRS